MMLYVLIAAGTVGLAAFVRTVPEWAGSNGTAVPERGIPFRHFSLHISLAVLIKCVIIELI